MKRLIFCLLAAGITSTSLADDAEYSADDFKPCAACHLDDGAGIPGAFPKIRNRAAAMASLEGGREYLIVVVSSGLMGPITADGTNYMGVMPGQKGAMQADAIAAVLNYLVLELTDDKSTGISPFTEEEVAASQAAISSAGLMTAATVRTGLIEQHGDQWPQ